MNEEIIDEIVQNTKNHWGNVKSNKITTSSLKKTLQYIRKTLNWNKLISGEYSYENLVAFCANSIIRYPAIGSILDLYTKDDESQKFIQNVQYNINKIQEIKTIVKSGDLPYVNTVSSECINLIYDMIKDEDTYKLSYNELFNKIYDIYKPQESYVNLKILIAYMAHFASKKNQTLAHQLKEKYDRYIQDGKITADVIFSSESNWKKQLINHLTKINTKRLAKTSAYPELTLRKILSRNVLLFRHIESYIEVFHKNVPMSIDSLHWFFNTVDIKELKKCIIWIANNKINADNDRVKSKHTKHHARDFVKNTIVFFKTRIPDFMFCKKDLYTMDATEILGKVDDQREIPTESIRRHFYDDEITKIMDFVKDDIMYTLIFTILREVGLRIGAVVTLQVKHFMNHKGEYLENCRKLEKGKKYRTFPIGENLKEKLKLYLNENPELKNNINSYLFPSKSGKHISTDSIRNKLIRITEKLDIYGHHVHPHAFRHTIVNNLMAEGNKLENVSKFMGHSSIATTEQYYWTTELENIIPTMSIPWLNGYKKNFAVPENIQDEENEVPNDLSTDLLVSIIGVYHSLLDEGQKLIVKQRVPNIEEIFANICEYSMTNSLASSNTIKDDMDDDIKDFI